MIKSIKNKIKVKEILKFLVGGGSAVLIDALTYVLLNQYVDLLIAKAISYVAGATVGFIINKHWTFESKKFSVYEIIRYIILYLCSAMLNTSVNKIVLIIIPSATFAFLCATGISTILNFFGQKFFVFRAKEKK